MQTIQEVQVSDTIPQSVRFLFPFKWFNEMQSQILRAAFHSDKNLVVAAPTGSGKTVILELALARLLISHRNTRAFRCVYMAPSKALCQQRWTDWKLKFDPLNIQVLEVTGDVDWREILKNISDTSIVVTTPEKWDSLTRMWRENVFSLGIVDLLLLDEVHHLGEERGAVLETVVVRLMMINSSQLHSIDYGHEDHHMRIVALSATLPNIADVGRWLHCDSEHTYYFDERFRPVPLRVLCFGYENKGNQFLFEKSLDRHLKSLILTYAAQRQAIIFCASKKGAQNCAHYLSHQNFIRGHNSVDQWMQSCCTQMQDKNLVELVPFGVAYHHAGLPPDDRMIIEQLFLHGRIRVLCSTSTLAHGMNLPAHLVIVKGTHAWRGSTKGYERLKRSDVIQMLGRAGRPGFDEEGVAIIMTSLQDQSNYSSIALHADVVTSHLEALLYEAIVAEVSQRVIVSLESCISWIKATFYCVRLQSMRSTELGVVESLDGFLTNLCSRHLQDLHGAGLLVVADDLGKVEPLQEAHIMSRSLIRFNSMKLFMDLTAIMKMDKLIRALSFCEELHKPVRRSDKKILNDLMRNIRFPSKERVQEQHHKTFVLLQAAVGCPDIKDFALRIEQAEMVDVASRLLKGLLELAIHRHWGMLLECVVLLERALRTRLWEGSHSCQFIQCHDLSSSTIKTLCDRGIRNVNEIYGSSIAQVQQLIGCSPQEARILIHFSASVHRSKLVAEMVVDTDGKLRIEVKRAELGNDIVGLQAIAFILLCYDVKTGQLVCFRRLQAGCTGAVFAVTVPDVHEALGRLRCRLLGNLVGADVCVGAQIPTDDTFQPDATSTKAKPRDPNPSIAVGKSQHKAAAKALPSVDQGDECIEGPSQHDQPCYVPWKDTYLKAGPLLDRIPNPTTPSLPLLARNLPAITKPIPVNMSARIVHAMMPSPASQRCEQPLSSPTVANKRLFFEFNCPDDDATPASKAICLHHKQPSKQSEDDFQPNAKAVQSQGAHPVSQVAMKKATMLQDLQVATKIQDQLFSAAFM